jgi:acyl carrier protein
MTQPSVEQRVREVIATTFRLLPEDAGGDLRMSSPPAWDSLGHMSLVVALEKEFGVRFPGTALAGLTSVDGIIRELGVRNIR